jgi:hypothetical protein
LGEKVKVDFAGYQMFEGDAPVGQELSLEELMSDMLPKDVFAKIYRGTRERDLAAPRAGTLGLLALLAAKNAPNVRTHRWAMAADPFGYLQSVAGNLTESGLRQLLTQANSPVVQAYLKYAAKPGSRLREQAFVKSMLRALKAEVRQMDALEQAGKTEEAKAALAGFEKSMVTFSELAGNLKVLEGQKLGEWQKRVTQAGKTIWGPDVLFQPGGKGALGAYLDILNRLPVKLDPDQMEKHRRREFREASQAA